MKTKIYAASGREIRPTKWAPCDGSGILLEDGESEVIGICSESWAHAETWGEWVNPETHDLLWVHRRPAYDQHGVNEWSATPKSWRSRKTCSQLIAEQEAAYRASEASIDADHAERARESAGPEMQSQGLIEWGMRGTASAWRYTVSPACEWVSCRMGKPDWHGLILAVGRLVGATGSISMTSYESHEDSFGGLAGGDYHTTSYAVIDGWAAPLLDSWQQSKSMPTDWCQQLDVIADRHWGETVRRNWRGMLDSTYRVCGRPPKESRWGKVLARLRVAQDRARELRRTDRREKMADLRRVRRDWRDLIRWRKAPRLHSVAAAMLDRIRVAQSRAMELRDRRESPARESAKRAAQAQAAADILRAQEDYQSACERDRRERQAAKDAAEKAKAEEKARFLSKGTWSALDNLKVQ